MKLSKYKEEYQWFSGKASDISRSAAFAGIALIWVFKINSGSTPKIPNVLLIPIFFFALGLAFDLLHYVLGAIIWRGLFRYQESKLANKSDDPDLSHSTLLVLPLEILFGLKLGSVILGYWFVLKYLLEVW